MSQVLRGRRGNKGWWTRLLHILSLQKNKENKGKQNQRRVKEKGKSLKVQMRNLPNHSAQALKWSFAGLVWAGLTSFATFFPSTFYFEKFQTYKIIEKNITMKILLYFTQIHWLLISWCVLAFFKPPFSLPVPQQPFESILQTSWLRFTPKYYSKYPLKAPDNSQKSEEWYKTIFWSTAHIQTAILSIKSYIAFSLHLIQNSKIMHCI